MSLTHFFSTTPARRAASPVWSVAVALVVLTALSLLVAGVYLNRSESTMVRVLTEKGSALISSLEGGVRTGKRSPGGLRFQYLLEEIAGLPQVRFIVITMPDGTILAHGDPLRTGEILSTEGGRELSPAEIAALAPGEDASWTLMNMEGAPAFVVYRLFYPKNQRSDSPGRKGNGTRGPDADNSALGGMHRADLPYVFLGFDIGPLVAARERDIRLALFSGCGVFGAGLVVLLGVYGLRRLRSSRRGQRVAEALAEELAVTLPDGLMLLDAKGRIARMNGVALRMLGMESAPQGRRAAAVLPSPLKELADRLSRESTLPDTEIRLDREGRAMFLAVRGGHVEDGQEGRLGSMLILRDLSEVRRLEAEIRRREQLAAVGNLAAGVAHEIRNPLSSIKGYATYFSGRFPEGSEDREAARVMVGEVERLNRAISDLIGISRPTDVRLRPVDIGELVRDTVRLITQDASLRKVEIGFVAEDGLLASADPDRLRQVVLNLCLNALDAMPEGGRLDIALSTWTEQTGSKRVMLEVRDTGVGIPPGVLPRIFDPYFTTKGQGTGLGLATVHKIMEAHGGSVTASSDPGCGACFRLFLPLADPVETGKELNEAEHGQGPDHSDSGR